MTQNTKIALGIVTLVLVVAGGVYAYSLFGSVKTPLGGIAEKQTLLPLVLQGVVTDVNAANLQISIQVSTTSVMKTVLISPATKIEKTILQKSTKALAEKHIVTEVNIGDLHKGDGVTVQYQSDTGTALEGVSEIAFTVEGSVDAYNKSLLTHPSPYLKGKVVAVDIAGKSLQYNPYLFDTLSTTTMSIAIPEGIPVYRIADPARVSITHTWVASTLTDIQQNQTIFVLTDPVALAAGKVTPKTLLILEK